MTVPRTVGEWRTSTHTHTHQDSSCVEVAPTSLGGALVRDTKDRQGGFLDFAPGDWHALIARVKNGELTR